VSVPPNGLDNVRQMWDDAFYWNALKNMVYYVLAISVEYVIAFGLALLLNAQIRARKFFRVVFLLPLMLSPVAVSWMIGKSMLEVRFGPVARLLRDVGIRIIFKLKLADVIINVTSGGPGGATDSVTSFIFREYRDRSNVGYGTLLAIVYLILIIIFVTALLKLVSRWMERPA